MDGKIIFRYLTRFTRGKGNFKCIFVVLILFSCEKIEEKSKSSHPNEQILLQKLEEFRYIFPHLYRYEWNFHSGYEYEDEVSLELMAQVKDTTIFVALWKTISTEDNNLNHCYSITRYVITYHDNQFVYKIHMLGGIDTLYHYYFQEPLNHPRDKIFIRGKYRYLYEIGVLDSLQKRYYKNNEDSLIRIEGNQLPLLPSSS